MALRKRTRGTCLSFFPPFLSFSSFSSFYSLPCVCACSLFLFRFLSLSIPDDTRESFSGRETGEERKKREKEGGDRIFYGNIMSMPIGEILESTATVEIKNMK